MICLLVRDFAPTQERRLNPTLPESPLILIESGHYRPTVIATDATARHSGVRPGIFAGQARTLCPSATLLPVAESRYRRLFTDISRTLLSVTDRLGLEYQPTSAVWYTDDARMLSLLRRVIEEETGIVAQVGTAATLFTARVAAAMVPPGEVCSVPAGEEAAFLAPYAVTLLPLDKTMRRRLPLLGIRTLGQFAGLPRGAVHEQFGQHGRWLHDLASGIDIRPLSTFKAPAVLRVCRVWDEPVVDRQIVQRVLEQLARQLIADLDGQVAHQVTVLLHQVDGVLLEAQRQPHEPVRDGLYLLRVLLQMLSALPVSAGIETVTVRLNDIRARKPVQLSLFEAATPVHHLHDLVPEWAARYRQATFYRLLPADDTGLPEHMVVAETVQAG